MENSEDIPNTAAELLQVYTDSKHNELLRRIDSLKDGQDKQQHSIDALTRAVVGEDVSGNAGLLNRITEAEKQLGKLQTYVTMGYGGAGVIGIAWAILKGFKVIG